MTRLASGNATLADSIFAVYAASALAGNSVVRSTLGGTLPLAGPASKDSPNSLSPPQHHFSNPQESIWPCNTSMPHCPTRPQASCPERAETLLTRTNRPVYAKLNPHWAGTLLGLVQVAIIPIPVVFYRYGHRIRMKSALIRSMQRDKEKLESKRRSGVRGARSSEEKKVEDGDGLVKVSSRIV